MPSTATGASSTTDQSATTAAADQKTPSTSSTTADQNSASTSSSTDQGANGGQLPQTASPLPLLGLLGLGSLITGLVARKK
jgi:hypothetical protein